jgi:hypothetical protein
MTAPDLLYPAIFVFTMMVIGLVLTIREFSSDRLKKQGEQDQSKNP